MMTTEMLTYRPTAQNHIRKINEKRTENKNQLAQNIRSESYSP